MFVVVVVFFLLCSRRRRRRREMVQYSHYDKNDAKKLVECHHHHHHHHHHIIVLVVVIYRRRRICLNEIAQVELAAFHRSNVGVDSRGEGVEWNIFAKHRSHAFTRVGRHALSHRQLLPVGCVVKLQLLIVE